jgi:hypothetical protein
MGPPVLQVGQGLGVCQCYRCSAHSQLVDGADLSPQLVPRRMTTCHSSIILHIAKPDDQLLPLPTPINRAFASG